MVVRWVAVVVLVDGPVGQPQLAQEAGLDQEAEGELVAAQRVVDRGLVGGAGERPAPAGRPVPSAGLPGLCSIGQGYLLTSRIIEGRVKVA